MFLIATALICRCLNPLDTLRLSLDTPPSPIDIRLLLIASTKNSQNFFLFFKTFAIKSNCFWFNFDAVVSSICHRFAFTSVWRGAASVYNIINNITSIAIRGNLISDKDKSQEFNYKHSTAMRCHENNERNMQRLSTVVH